MRNHEKKQNKMVLLAYTKLISIEENDVKELEFMILLNNNERIITILLKQNMTQ